MTVVLGVLFRLPLPIIAVQILAIDLGTDVLPSLTLAYDKGDPTLMQEPAKHKSVSLLNRKNVIKLIVTGLVMGVGANLSFYLLTRSGASYAEATTASYATIVVCQVVSVVMTHLDFRGSILSKEMYNNGYLLLSELFSFALLFSIVYFPPFQNIIQTAPLNFSAWIIPFLSAILLAILGQIFFMKKDKIIKARPLSI